MIRIIYFILLVILLPSIFMAAVGAIICLLILHNYEYALVLTVVSFVCLVLSKIIKGRCLNASEDTRHETVSSVTPTMTAQKEIQDETAGAVGTAGTESQIANSANSNTEKPDKEVHTIKEKTPARTPAEASKENKETSAELSAEASRGKKETSAELSAEALKEYGKTVREKVAEFLKDYKPFQEGSVKNSTIAFLQYLSKHFDFIEVIGGYKKTSGNSHDEIWEFEFFLTDPKYKDYYNIDAQIDRLEERYRGWGWAGLTITDEISSSWDEYYIRIKDTLFSMDSLDWSEYVETKHFCERTRPDSQALLELLAESKLRLPSSEVEEEEFLCYCEKYFREHDVI